MNIHKKRKMGCINSVPNVKQFSTIDNKTFDDKQTYDDDFVSEIIYISNMQWCMTTSRYIENLCFVLATFQDEQLKKVKSIILRILSSKLVQTPAGKEFKFLADHINDAGVFYLECMVCIRKHAVNNTPHIFNDVAKYIKIAILSGCNSQ